MNILLIYPPHEEKVQNVTFPPLGLAYLASVLQKRNYHTVILDLNLNRVSDHMLRERLFKMESPPDIVGIGGIVTSFKNIISIAKICKDIFPRALFVCGGSAGSTVPHLLFGHTPIDICVGGEGEETLLEIVRTIENGAEKDDLIDIPGVISCKSDNSKELLFGPPRNHIKDLDVIGFPAYELIDVETYSRNGIRDILVYKDDLSIKLDRRSRHMSVLSSRGCIGNCSFCYRQFSKIGLFSGEHVKNHILFLNNKYGVNIISFDDELFNITRERVSELVVSLSEVKKKVPDFFFRVNGARVDRIELDQLKALRDIGCFQITYGLESGSQKILDLMNKKVTVEQNRTAVVWAREAGLHCVPQFIVGHPGEDKVALNETFQLARAIDFWNTECFHYANAYPGSRIYDDAKGKGLIPDEFEYVIKLGGTDKYLIPLGDIRPYQLHALVLRYQAKRRIKKLFANNNFLIAIGYVLFKVLKNVPRIFQKIFSFK